MEPIGLTLAIFSTFKEVYLLSQFIGKLVKSAKNSEAEHASLEVEFHFEFLYMRSTGLFFLQNNGVVNDSGMNKEWLLCLYEIFEKLRLVCADYAKLAEEQDEDYRKYSPYLNESTANSGVIEFDIANDGPDLSKIKPLSIASRRSTSSFKIWSTQTANSWKWALRDRKKLQEVLRKFQKWNQKLKELVPLALGVNPRFRELSPESLAVVISNQDASIIGFGTHAQLRQRIVDPSFETRTLRLEDVSLDTRPGSSALSVGTLLFKTPHDSTQQEEQVLIEYKYQAALQLFVSNQSSASLSSSTTSNSLSPVSSQTSALTLSQTAEKDEEQVRQLASLLSSSGTDDLRTLPFRGYVQEKHENRYAFIFSFPSESDHSDPRSLNDIIEHASSIEKLSLPTRFKVAQMIAKTISAFHADGWVHKSIQSQSIVFFRDRDNPVGQPSYQNPYLVDFEYSRPEDAATLMVQYDSDLGKDLYRHPDRQGPPRSSFRRSHDLYSLGVVLLEVGVWQTAMSIYKEASAQMKKGVYPSPRGIRNIFIDVAKRRVQHHMGPAYLDAVLYCLQGGTSSSTSAGENFSMDFYEKVVQALDVKHLLI